MTRKQVIGVDVDGVLANFNEAFARLLEKQTGQSLVDPDHIDPQVWHWPEAAGYSPIQVKAAWDFVYGSHEFWRSLFRLKDARAFLQSLERSGHDIYFITARQGETAKGQTEQWLNPWFRHPTVLLSFEKGLAARALNMDAYIDDRVENCLEVAKTGARVYMPVRGYNQGVYLGSVKPINSILGMLDHEHIVYDDVESVRAA